MLEFARKLDFCEILIGWYYICTSCAECPVRPIDAARKALLSRARVRVSEIRFEIQAVRDRYRLSVVRATCNAEKKPCSTAAAGVRSGISIALFTQRVYARLIFL